MAISMVNHRFSRYLGAPSENILRPGQSVNLAFNFAVNSRESIGFVVIDSFH